MKKTLSALGVLIIVGGFLLYFNESKPVPSEPQIKRATLHIEGRRLVLGPPIFEVKKGDTVTLNITADERDEFHLHGYEKSVDLEAGREGTLTLLADTVGRFPAELEGSKTEVFFLEVQP